MGCSKVQSFATVLRCDCCEHVGKCSMSGFSFGSNASYGGKTIRAANTKKYRVRSKKNKSRRHKKTRSKRRPGCVRGEWYCK